MNHYQLIILGSGPAGYTASIYSARANLNPVLITGLYKGGQIVNTNSIENWPGDYNNLTGYELMQRMQLHANKFNVKTIFDHINKVNFHKKPFKLYGDINKYTCDALIIATGSSPRYLNLSSEKEYEGKGISFCATCDGFLYRNKNVAVIGGGNTAIEESLYLSKIARKVYLVHRRDTFNAEKILINQVINQSYKGKIIIYYNHIVKDFIGNKSNVTDIILRNIKDNLCKKISIDGAFIAIGNIPNTSIFKNQIELNNYGYINTKINTGENNVTSTSIDGIFAAGDVVDMHYRQAITSAASGCMAALDAEKFLNKKI